MRTQLTSGDKFYQSCNKVFCGWDYSLNKEKAAVYKHKNLLNEYKVRPSNESCCHYYRVRLMAQLLRQRRNEV